MVARRGSAGSTRPAVLQCGCLREPGRPRGPPRSLTQQVPAGDAPLGDGRLHGADGGGEDVGLLEDLRQLGTVQGAEGGGIVLLGAFVELQHGELIAPGLGVPVLVLTREGGQPGLSGGSRWTGNYIGGASPISYMLRTERNHPAPWVSSLLTSLLAFRVAFSWLPKVEQENKNYSHGSWKLE